MFCVLRDQQEQRARGGSMTRQRVDRAWELGSEMQLGPHPAGPQQLGLTVREGAPRIWGENRMVGQGH